MSYGGTAITEPLDGFLPDGLEQSGTLFRGFIDKVELDTVVFQDLIREEVHPLGEVFVEDEAEDVVAELVGSHFTPEGVGDVPKLGLEGLLVVF